MVFSSHIFLFYFLPLSLLLYYAAPRWLKVWVLTGMSYIFYGWWDPWLITLMFWTTFIDFYCGNLIAEPGASPKKRKVALLVSLISNLVMLAFFKYAAFAAGTITSAMEAFGNDSFGFPAWVYVLPLPIGISFYTFQSISYCVDIYRGHARPAKSFIDFLCFVSLYPHLVAGPIVRYATVAEQLRHRNHSLELFVYGFTRFNFGLAKKILLANPLGLIADACFGAGDGSLGMLAAWAGITAYAFQIYFDFSAYSDMALGLGRMFGFRLPENFNMPYRADSITDFWRRWHISLSTFLRDYLYIPLGGNRVSIPRTYANLIITMLIGGLWHGAQWTFVVWGLIHGLMLAFERMVPKIGALSRVPHPIRVAFTFVVVLITWVFFRAENFDVASRYLSAMFGLAPVNESSSLLNAYIFRPYGLFYLAVGIFAIWVCPQVSDILRRLDLRKAIAGLALLVLATVMMFTQEFNPFLYFQF